MMKYKLTNHNLSAFNGFQWVVGRTFETDGYGKICSSSWLHYYHDPLTAVFMNPMHGNFASPRLWQVEADGHHYNENGLKGACTKLTIVNEIELPKPSVIQHIAFGILCARAVCNDYEWEKWADNWLNGADRSHSKSHLNWEKSNNKRGLSITRKNSLMYAAACQSCWSAYCFAEHSPYTPRSAISEAMTWAAAAAETSEKVDSSELIDFVKIAQEAMRY